MRYTLTKRSNWAASVRRGSSAVFAVFAVFAVPLALLSAASIAEAGTPRPGPFKRFANCPFHYTGPFAEGEWTGVKACVAAKSSSGSEFRAGKVTVHLTKPISLRGGFSENEETGELQFLGAEGGETLVPQPEPAPSLTEDVEPALLSTSDRATFEKDVAKGRTKVNATIELAGPATDIVLNEGNLLDGTGTALGLPVKVKLSNPFLGKDCYDGSDEHPITIALTTGTSGSLTGQIGKLKEIDAGEILEITSDLLVNNTYAAPGVAGCGEGGGANAAVDSKIGVPAEEEGENAAIIGGKLWQTSRSAAEEFDES